MRRETFATRISNTTWRRVYERDGGRCVLCGAPAALQCAHYIGRAQGGLGREDNLVLLCADCHREYDQSAARAEIRDELRDYLRGRYADWDEEELTYRKYGGT